VRLAVALTIAAGPALALGPQDCVKLRQNPAPGELPLPGETTLRSWHGPAVDLGGGWVMQAYEFASEYGTQFGSKVVSCAPGTALTVVERAVSPDDKVLLAAGKSAGTVFRKAIAAPESIPLSKVIAELESAGARVGEDLLQPATFESCACAVFYPELRGGKIPWADGQAGR